VNLDFSVLHAFPDYVMSASAEGRFQGTRCSSLPSVPVQRTPSCEHIEPVTIFEQRIQCDIGFQMGMRYFGLQARRYRRQR
jgi:hypothetical protein